MFVRATLEKQVQTARLLHFVFFIGSLLELCVLYALRKDNPGSGALSTPISYALFFVGIYCLVGPPLVARRIRRKALPALQQNPADAKALKQLTTAAIVNSSACNACVLWGWILCFLGTPLTWTYILLWSFAAVGFILFIPQMPVNGTSLMQHNPPPGP